MAYSYQTPVCIADFVSCIAKCLVVVKDTLTSILTAIGLLPQAFPVVTVSTLNSTGPGTVLTGWLTVTVVNQGVASAIFNGATLLPGASLSLGDFGGPVAIPLSYDGTGTNLLVSEVR